MKICPVCDAAYADAEARCHRDGASLVPVHQATGSVTAGSGTRSALAAPKARSRTASQPVGSPQEGDATDDPHEREPRTHTEEAEETATAQTPPAAPIATEAGLSAAGEDSASPSFEPLVEPTDKDAKPPPPSPLTIVPSEQRRFGRYVLLCRFASGGMADLFLASVPGPAGFEKLVAIKRIHSHLTQEEGFVEMFLNEARLAARIMHPNVVDVTELGRVDDSYFIAMEYVPGQSLRSVLQRTELSFPVAARILSHVAAGLHAAHEIKDSFGELLHVVHRDVSPSNILISYEGGVKILDFGVARARGNIHTTAAGVLKGKFAYMSPEQARAEQIDRRADIFSLGVVLYEATTMRRLFKAENDHVTLMRVLNEPILPPCAFASDYPMRLEQIVMRALARDPTRRYQTAREMHEDLEGFLHESGTNVLPGEIGSLMKELFAEQRAEQERIIRQARAQANDPPSAAEITPSSYDDAPLVGRPKDRRPPLIGRVALLLSLLAVLCGAVAFCLL